MTNNIRFDLSNWLIHFFRDIDLEKDQIDFPEIMAPMDLCEDTKYPAFFMLRSAIKQLKLWSGYSYRNSKPTIYGSYPATCFTEMPIAAFIQAGRERRQKAQNMSPLALLFEKKIMYDIGARPVIYDLFPIKGEYISGNIINNKIINKDDQYRYVRFCISYRSAKSIDWTHEREWRWPFRDRTFLANYKREIHNMGIVNSYRDIPGLDLSLNIIKRIGVIVETKQQADYIMNDLVWLIDSKQIPHDKFRFIIIASNIHPNLDIISPQEVNKLIQQSIIDPLEGINLSQDDVEKYNNQFNIVVNNFNCSFIPPNNEVKEYGSCYLWLYERKHPLTRALLEKGKLHISRGGRYLVPFDSSCKTCNLQNEENKMKALSKVISKQFNIQCGYFTILGDGVFNPTEDDVPFYCDPPIENSFIYNKNF